MGIKLNREKFWQEYHKSFDVYGSTTQSTVTALNVILDKFEAEDRLKYTSWYSYSLATAYHETGINGNHFVPVKEGKAGPNSTAWKNYQSKYWGTGFYGRGLVQVTHEENYLKIGQLLGYGDLFVRQPNLLLNIEYAYEAMIIGMVKGIYRADKSGKRQTLARYLKSDDASVQDYTNAREIINGDKVKNGLMIGNYAEKFEHILTNSKVDDTQPTVYASSPDIQEVVLEPENVPQAPETPVTAVTVTGDSPIVNIPIPPKDEPVTLKSVTTSIWTKVIAGFTALTGLGINLGTALETKISEITLSQALIFVCATVLVIFAIYYFKLRQDAADHQTNKLIDAAADTAKNTVELKK